MFGGSVNGGQVLGKYPDNFSEGDPAGLALSRGRMLPTYPWGECTLSNKQLSSHDGSLSNIMFDFFSLRFNVERGCGVVWHYSCRNGQGIAYAPQFPPGQNLQCVQPLCLKISRISEAM